MHSSSRPTTVAFAVLFIASLVSPVVVTAASPGATEVATTGAARAPRVAPTALTCPVTYPTFPDGTGLNLVNTAAVVDGLLQVTPATADVRGQAWFANRVVVENGFTTDFTVQIAEQGGASDNDGPGGDGMTFTIQDSSATSDGRGGGSLGYGDIPKSLAVELDTFNNLAENGDPDGNHVAVHSRGEDPNGAEADAQLAVASLGPDIDLQDGASHQVRVSYLPGGPLDVFVDDLENAVLSVEGDLSTFLGLTDGQAWVGFTAATGGAFETHDVLTWTYCELNQPPVVDAGSDLSLTEGGATVLDATATDPEGSALTTSWSFTPDPAVDPGATCTFGDPAVVDTVVSCTDDGDFTLTLTASDGVNPPVSDTAIFSLTNIDPTVSINAPLEGATFDVGVAVALEAAIADASNDTHACSIDWGDTTVTDGAVAAGVCTGSHSYAAAGPYTITVTATDDDEGSGSDAVAITVTEEAVDQPPVVDAGVDPAGTEGSFVLLDATATDPEGGELTTSWSVTADPTVDPGADCTFADPAVVDTTVSCTDDGTYTLTLTASDGVNEDVTDTAILTLVNTDPTVEITAPLEGATVDLGVAVELAATIADAGSNDTHSCSIDWGDTTVTDGVIAAGECTDSHSYAAAGPYTITVSVTDDDEGSGSDTVAITVAEAPEPGACTHVGTEGPDRIAGTPGPDVICGLGGDDILSGLAGDDLLIGGPGDNDLRGGSGRDGISYAAAPGRVTVNLADGTASGAWGVDELVSLENVLGSEFDDRIIGDGDPNRLLGNAGSDTISGRGANDVIEGGTERDIIHGGFGNDRIDGGPSPTRDTTDRLFGDEGSRDSCLDGPGLEDFKDDSCEQTGAATAAAPGSSDRHQTARDVASRKTGARRVNGRGPARRA